MNSPEPPKSDLHENFSWQGRTALVTGGGGFLGRCLVEQLHAAGATVRTFSRREYDFLAELGVQQCRGDLREADAVAAACEGVDFVFHAAALAGIWGPWRDYYGINTLGTQHVIAGCQQSGVKYLVYTSSPSVTFAGSDQVNVDESAPYPFRWLANYPKSKALAEQAVVAANRQEGDNPLLTCSLRPHLIWGPRDQHLIPRLIDRARKGQLRRVGDGTNLVDTIFVENAAIAHLQAAIALATNMEPAGKVYFLSQGEPVNLWEWIDQILALADLPPVKKSISLRAAYLAGGVLESIWAVMRKTSEPRMTRFLASQLATSHYFDLTAAREDFGYEPVVSMSEGMQRLAGELASTSAASPGR